MPNPDPSKIARPFGGGAAATKRSALTPLDSAGAGLSDDQAKPGGTQIVDFTGVDTDLGNPPASWDPKVGAVDLLALRERIDRKFSGTLRRAAAHCARSAVSIIPGKRPSEKLDPLLIALLEIEGHARGGHLAESLSVHRRTAVEVAFSSPACSGVRYAALAVACACSPDSQLGASAAAAYAARALAAVRGAALPAFSPEWNALRQSADSELGDEIRRLIPTPSAEIVESCAWPYFVNPRWPAERQERVRRSREAEFGGHA